MESLTLKYTSGLTVFSRDFNLVGTRGFSSPWICKILVKSYKHLDGLISSKVLGFKRRIQLDFGVLTNSADIDFLLLFFTGTNRRLVKDNIVSRVDLENYEEYSNEWLDNCELGRQFVVDLIESTILLAWPTQQIQVGDMAYIAIKVEVTGTPEAPEQFETNVGKLALDSTGHSYPNFDSDTHIFHIDVDGLTYQECRIYIPDGVINEPSEVSGNLKFKLSRGNSGEAASDGKFYCNIVIILQEKNP